MNEHEQRLQVAREVLDGLSVGDALGEALSYQCYRARELADFSTYRDGSVRYTDDTEMAIGLFEQLDAAGEIDEGRLAWRFASRFRADPERGYGRMARHILREIGAGVPWREAASGAFGGSGSFGNGAAMRVAPLGAYFADDPARITEAAGRSARVTHWHREGIAGAIAVAQAVGAAVRARSREQADAEITDGIWESVLRNTPEGVVFDRLKIARNLNGAPGSAARELGNGAEISVQDTVPFCIWNAARCIGNFEGEATYREALLSTVEVDGDCDTNAAIVGGIVAGRLGPAGIPEGWLRVREGLPPGIK